MTFRLKIISSAVLSAALLSACGGGESAAPTPVVVVPPVAGPNTAPVISASKNLSQVMETQRFTLDASGSTDADNDALTYSWAQISGSDTTIEDSTAAVQVLAAPDITADETLEFEVTVSDGRDAVTSVLSIDVKNLWVTGTNASPTGLDDEGYHSIEAILPSGAGDGFKIFWHNRLRGNDSRYVPVSSQVIERDWPVRIGGQVEANFFGALDERAALSDVIISGDTTYSILRV